MVNDTQVQSPSESSRVGGRSRYFAWYEKSRYGVGEVGDDLVEAEMAELAPLPARAHLRYWSHGIMNVKIIYGTAWYTVCVIAD